MKPRHKRLAIIVTAVVGLTVASLFVLNAFRSNLVFFFSPTEALEGKAPVDRTFRLGGMVEKGSVRKSPDGLKVDFVVTDNNRRIKVYYEGLLPDLFREGQGVVAQGKLEFAPATSHMTGRTSEASRASVTSRDPRLGPIGDGQPRFIAREVLAKHDEKYMPPEAAKAMQGGTFVPGDKPRP
jgi:cytochrome c-type biogenesis protein CcmE